MSHCTYLANRLDLMMLQARTPTVQPYPENTLDSAMPYRIGTDVAVELGGRLLVRYIRRRDLPIAPPGTSPSPVLPGLLRKAWASPTPLSPSESVAALALPFQTERRTHAILLDPAKISLIQGPRRIAGGSAIEYVLPNGYLDTALAFSWALEVR